MPNYGAMNLQNLLGAMKQGAQAYTDKEKQAEHSDQQLRNLIQGDAAKRKAEQKQLMAMYGVDNLGDAMDAATSKGQSIKMGDIGVGQDPTLRLRNQSSIQSKRLGDFAKQHLKPVGDILESLERTHSLLDVPSAINDKKIGVQMARFVEGPGQRLLERVIQSMGADKGTLEGSAQQKLNWLTGAANSGLTPDQRNKMRESLHQYFDSVAEDYGQAKDKFSAYAPSLGHDLDPVDRQRMVDSEIGLHDKRLRGLSKRREDYLKQAGTNTEYGKPQPVQHESPTGPIDRLMNWLSPKKQAAPAAPAGGMSFEEWKKRKAEGTL
jgi:hypothetical protein